MTSTLMGSKQHGWRAIIQFMFIKEGSDPALFQSKLVDID
jgi:hypothetical protein